MQFLRKNWSSLLLILLILLLVFPQTRMPIQITLNRIFSFAPSEVAAEEREVLEDYQWQLKKIEGSVENLKDSEGEVIVINLWATWCPPCIAEMPAFQELYNDYKNKVNFYFISSEKEEKLKTFLQKRNLSVPVYQPLTEGPELLQSRSLPTTYVISRKGEVVVKKIGAANWNDEDFRKLLNNLISE